MTITTTETNQSVLVFKTNINNNDEVKKLSSVLNKPEILKWNIDFDDCDKVLRIVSDKLSYADIILSIKAKGVECSELE